MNLQVNHIYNIDNIYKIYDAKDSFTIILSTTNISIDKLKLIFDEVEYIKIINSEDTRSYENKYKLKSINIDIINNTTTIYLCV